MNNGDKPAFLEKIIEHPRGGNEKSFGLTKREYFAAMAMQGILASSADRGETAVAQMSVKFADGLLKQFEL